jgi:hypothetical protein
MKTVFEDEIANLPDLAKTYLFKISFYDLQTAKYVDELEIRARRILNEKSIVFDEFQDFFVSKFFDEHKGEFNCDVVITFLDSKLEKIVYTKYYKNRFLHITPIGELNQNAEGKLARVVEMDTFKNYGEVKSDSFT